MVEERWTDGGEDWPALNCVRHAGEIDMIENEDDEFFYAEDERIHGRPLPRETYVPVAKLKEQEERCERLEWQLRECHRLALGLQRADTTVDLFSAPAEEVRDLRIALEEGEKRWVSETVVATESERNDAERRCERLEAENSSLRLVADLADEAATRLQDAESRCERLEEALRSFGEHRAGCGVERRPAGPVDDSLCDCGLAAALQHSPGDEG